MVWTLVLLVGLPLAIGVWAALDRRSLRRQGRLPPPGRLGGLVAPIDEVFHPTAYAAHLVREAQTELPAPAPSPGDPPLVPGARRITIHLPER